MNILKKFMESSQKQELMMLSSGQFLLLRSEKSPKSSVECIYNDATLSIREVGQYAFELLVKKNADEAEVFNGDGSDDYSDDAVSILSTQSKKKEEEWAFPITEEIGLHKEWSKQGDMAFVWENTIGDETDEKVQFITTPDMSLNDIDKFLDIVYRCEYEAEYKETASNATQKELDVIAARSEKFKQETGGDSEEFVEKLQALKVDDSSSDERDSDDFEDAKESPEDSKMMKKGNSKNPIRAPKGKQLFMMVCKLSLFDPVQEQFCLQDEKVRAAVIETGKYEYWLTIEGNSSRLGTDIVPNINPTFNFEESAFIFNYDMGGVTLSYMLQFANKMDCRSCQIIISKCLWMSLNKKSWDKVPIDERNYILHFSTAVERDLDAIISDNDSKQEESSEEEPSDEEENHEYSKSILSSESFKETAQQRTSSAGNRSLTVAYKNNRSYVVRDDKIGIFKTDEEDIDFVATIKDLSDLQGKRIDPINPMLYMEDRSLIVQDSGNSKKIFKMDIERGKVIEEWGTGDRNVIKVGPTKKFDQLTEEQTVLAISENGLFQIDPRLNSKDKVALEKSKEYATKCNFSSIGTTGSGYIAVGSEKGDIRLYDRLGIRAKTAIPSLGKPIKHIIVSANGRWLLCTCDTSLLLIDLTIKTGKNADSLGFLKCFPKDENVKTYILNISPEHASYIVTSTKKPIKFTKASFNIGLGEEEQTIVTSSGPFSVSWSLKKILKGDRKPYIMKRYDANVIENNFEFGTDKNIIVALKDDVAVTKIKSFQSPNKKLMASDLSFFLKDEADEEK